MALFKNKYRIEPARLKYFDYATNAAYYVTICTKNRVKYFGEIVETHNGASPIKQETNNDIETHNCVEMHHHANTHNFASLQSTTMGNIAIEYWQQIPLHFPFVELDEFIVMPNHIHGILIINKPFAETHNGTSLQEWKPNQFGPQSQNLASIIRGFKSSVKRFANQHNIPFEWQPKYWDRVIRDEKEWLNIKNYILNNPQNWVMDENYLL